MTPTTAAGWVLIALAGVYAAQVTAWAAGLHRALRRSPPEPPVWPTVTVIVPARDEAAHIEACLASLLASDYPAGRAEIIVVDDFSRDDTAGRVRDVQRAIGSDTGGGDVLRLVCLADHLDDEDKGHKGAALAWGLREATGSVLLTTDADCVVTPGWMRGMVAALGTRAGIVAGAVRMDPSGAGVFGALQALEFAGLVGIGGGALGLNAPFMCNSASLAYPRRLFEALGVTRSGASALPERVTPWDDELLLLRVAADPTLHATFCPSSGAVVTARPERSVGAFWMQRRRWASLGTRYPGLWRGTIIRVVWLFFAALLASLAALVVWPHLWPFVAAAFGVKIVAETLLLARVLRHVGQMRLLAWHVPAQLGHLGYVVAMGVVAVMGAPSWKGRTFEPAEAA